MDKQLIIEELNKRNVPIPTPENQNQNIDKTLIFEELKKRKGIEWMTEEEIIEVGIISKYQEELLEDLENAIHVLKEIKEVK